MTIAYNLGIPNAPNNPSTDQPNMKTNNDNIPTYVAIDHVAFNTAGSGQHNQVTFNANNVAAVPAAPPVLFTNTVAGLPQLFFYSGDAAHSSNQYLISGTGGTGSGGSTFVLGGLIFKWGIVAAIDNNTISFSTLSGAAFPNNCLGVQLTLYTASASAANAFLLSVSPTPTASGFTPRIRTAVGTTGSATICYLAIGN